VRTNRRIAMNENELVGLHAQLDALKQEHRELDTTIAELATGTPLDQLRIQRLKRRKLRLKDEITRIENLLLPDIIA